MTAAPAASAASPAPPPPPVDGPRSAAERGTSVLLGLGIALLAVAVVVTTLYARADGDLDWSTFGVGLVSTLALLGVGLAHAALRIGGPSGATDLVAWPLAFGAVGAGLMTGVALDGGDVAVYLAGALVVVVGAAGYALAPSAPPVVAAVLGLVLVYGQGLDDTGVLDSDGAGGADGGFALAAIAVGVFVLVVSAVAWVLPAARVVVGVTVGVMATASYLALLALIALASLFAGFGALDPDLGGGPSLPDHDGDVYTVLACATVLVGGWLGAGFLTDAPGFRLLSIGTAATVLPAAMVVLAVEHPSVWGLVAAVLGGTALVVVVLRARSAPRP